MTHVGTVERLWRYPVKSMIGEELAIAEVGPRGLLGDRVRAVIDADGRIGSAKQSKQWPGLFATRAGYLREPTAAEIDPPVRLILPDGTTTTSDDEALSALLTEQFGREVRLIETPPEHAGATEELDDGSEQTFELHAGTFFDDAVLHLLATAALDRLGMQHPTGDFAPQRFRPNVLIAPSDARPGFAEDAWIGCRLGLGDEVQVIVNGACRRCVMVTLAQEDRCRDPLILRAAAQAHDACVGVYASIVVGGLLRRGDAVTLLGGGRSKPHRANSAPHPSVA